MLAKPLSAPACSAPLHPGLRKGSFPPPKLSGPPRETKLKTHLNSGLWLEIGNLDDHTANTRWDWQGDYVLAYCVCPGAVKYACIYVLGLHCISNKTSD